MNKVYGFEGECKQKHGETTYKVSDSRLLVATLTHKMLLAFRSGFHSLYDKSFNVIYQS
jgi:hypothetical protein